MLRIRFIIVLICVPLFLYAFFAMAEENKAGNYVREAARQAALAYDYAEKANYNSTGRVKYYARKAMEAAKKAEIAANNAYAELNSSE